MQRKFYVSALIFIIPFVLYLSFMSIGLDDFDSFAFAFALDRWDTALIEVHPPSFPVYVYVSKFVQAIMGDTQLALTFLSAIAGALGIILTSLIPQTHNHKVAGYIAGIILIFIPGYWLNSEFALSDIPGVTMALLSVFLFLKSKQSSSASFFLLGCFIGGLSLGLRIHNTIPIVLAGLWALIHLQRTHSYFIRISLSALALTSVAITLWLIPIYQAFDGYNGQQGFDAYLQRLDNHRQHIQSSDSLFRQDLSVDTITHRIESYLNGWSHILAGQNDTTLVVIVGLMLLGLIRLPIRDRFVWFVAFWLILEVTKVFLFASLERPRLYLPALIPLVLLVALGYGNWENAFPRLGIIGIVLLSVWTSLPLVQTLTQVAPPPEQATQYILDTYPLDNGTATVVSQGSFQAAQYHLDAYKQLYTPYFDAQDWANQIEFDQPEYLIVLDGDDIAPEVFQALTSRLGYVTIDDRIFERDPRVFPQHSTVRLQVMIQEKNLQPEQLQLSEQRVISTSNPIDGKYFGEGWYRIEDIGGTLARWTNQTAILRVTLPSNTKSMSFIATPYLSGQSVQVFINDILVEEIEINEIWQTHQITIPDKILVDNTITIITFKHTQAEFPENHNRQLATAYSQIYFE
jgi:4-amino-4-deoxy-L-arabinose transferase-like glycosyltransferase